MPSPKLKDGTNLSNQVNPLAISPAGTASSGFDTHLSTKMMMGTMPPATKLKK